MVSSRERKVASKPDTREEILRTASRLLQLNGFNGFSYGHIAKELGVKSAAVHYHFPSKAALGVALVDRFRTRYRLWMEDAAGLPAADQLSGYVAIHRRFLERGARVCPGGVLQAELYAVPEEVQASVTQMAQEVHDWLVEVLTAGRASGELTFEGPPEAMATVVGATVQGALQMARILGAEQFDLAEAQLWRFLGVSRELTKS